MTPDADTPDPVERHPLAPDASFDGGDVDCGGGLLLLIRRHIDPLAPGGLLEIRSTESTVEVELPAWCRLTGNELVSWTKDGSQRSYLVSKGPLAARTEVPPASPAPSPVATPPLAEMHIPAELPAPAPAPAIAPLSVMGIGSWPRPRWLLQALHDHLEGRLGDDAFHETADDAVRLALDAQRRAAVDVVTDGEQRRDNYASFVGGLLDNCQLIPLSDLTAMVDDPTSSSVSCEPSTCPPGMCATPSCTARSAAAARSPPTSSPSSAPIPKRPSRSPSPAPTC